MKFPTLIKIFKVIVDAALETTGSETDESTGDIDMHFCQKG